MRKRKAGINDIVFEIDYATFEGKSELMKVTYCGGLDYYKYAPEHLGIKQGMTELGWDWSIVDNVLNNPSGEETAGRINEYNPDMVIYGNTSSLTKLVCRHVRPEIKQIFWMMDYRAPEVLQEERWFGWTENAPYLTAIFISAGDHVELWRDAFGIKAYYAPQACFVPPALERSDDFSHDLLFIGGHDRRFPAFFERIKLLSQIEELSGISITHVNESDREERDDVYRNIPKYYYSSKVVLDVSHFWKTWGYCSVRFWHTASLGACAVAKRFPGCDKLIPDTCKWYFDTPEQAADLIRELLIDDEGREQTKYCVSQYAWRNHSYKIRFQQMIRCLETGSQVPMF